MLLNLKTLTDVNIWEKIKQMVAEVKMSQKQKKVSLILIDFRVVNFLDYKQFIYKGKRSQPEQLMSSCESQALSQCCSSKNL